jgi:hypothetical protein
VTTPRPPSFTAEFTALRNRVRTLEATRRNVVADPVTYFSDDAGNVVVSSDGVSGWGLGRPFLPVPFVVPRDVVGTSGWPETTSDTFIDMFYARHQVQHLYVTVMLDVFCGTGTTAELQVLDGTDPVGSVAAVDPGTTALTMTGPLTTMYAGVTVLHVQARRTEGTGSVAVQVGGAWGIQTPLA